MKLRCPSCGCAGDIGLFVEAQASRDALLRLFARDDIGRAVVGYVDLHKPATRAMGDARFMKLCAEVMDDVERGFVLRNGVQVNAPKAAWLWAIDEALKARDNGKLIVPLTGHGWIYAVLAAFKPVANQMLPEGMAVKTRPVVGHEKPRWEM